MNARGIPTAAYQVLHLLPEVGYPPQPGLTGGTRGGVLPARYFEGYPRWGMSPAGIHPLPGLMGVLEVGYCPSRVPLARSDGGYTRWCTPWQRYPLARSDGGVPEMGYPPEKGYPLARSDGGYPRWGIPWQGYPLPLAGPFQGTPPPTGVD